MHDTSSRQPQPAAGRPRRAGLVVLVAAALLAAACSGDDGGSPGSEPDDSSPTTESGPDTGAPGDSSAPGTDAPASETLTVGVVMPDVGSFARFASAQSAAVALAASDINDAGGVLGHDVEVLALPQRLGEGIDVAIDELAAAGVRAFVGPALSVDTADATRFLVDRDMFACSASSTRPGLVQPGHLARTALDDRLVATNAAHYVRDRLSDPEDPPTVAVLHRDDDYGTGIAAVLRSVLEYEDIAVTTVSYRSEANLFAEQVAEVRQAAADLVVVVSLGEGLNAVRELLAAGVDPATIVGLDGLGTPRLAEQVSASDPTAADGITVIGTSGDLAFMSRLATSADAQVLYGAQAYDCAISVALAAEAVGGRTDPLVFAEAMADVTTGGEPCTTYADCLAKLRAGDDIDYDGPSGPLELGSDGQPGGGRFIIASVQDGQLTQLESNRVVVADILADAAARLALQEGQFTAALQSDLRLLGYYTGEVDGIASTELADAISQFQADEGLPATGVADDATIAAIAERVGTRKSATLLATAELQWEMQQLGFYDGPVDGIYRPALADAVRALQASLGVPETGLLDVATVRAAFAAGLLAQPAPPATTVPPGTTAPPATQPPQTSAPPETAPPATQPPVTQPPETSVLDVIAATPELSAFAAVLEMPELAALRDELADMTHRFTVFAPSNTALEQLGDGGLDPATVERVVRFHVLRGAFALGDLVSGDYATLLDGQYVNVDVAGGAVSIGGVGVESGDVEADNGVVHVLGGVLVAPSP